MQRDASACHPEHSIEIDNVMRGTGTTYHMGSGGGGCIELCMYKSLLKLSRSNRLLLCKEIQYHQKTCDPLYNN